MWTSLIVKILKLHSTDSIIDTAIEMSDPSNTVSTQRLGMNILVALIGKFPHKYENAQSILMRCCQDLRPDFRRILVTGMADIVKLCKNKVRALEELKELLDDEESTVKQQAFLVLADCLDLCLADDIERSQIMPVVNDVYRRSATN